MTTEAQDLTAYRMRERFTLFELACLLHGNEPEQVFNVAFYEWRKQNPDIKIDGGVFADMLFGSPAMFLGGAEGGTLALLKIATGAGIRHSVDVEYAKKLAQNFGLIYPFDTAPAQTPATLAPVAVEPANDGPAPTVMSDGLPTTAIATLFDGVNEWPKSRWPKNLSASKWLHPARVALGGAGVANSMWNPLTLAQLMLDNTKGKRPRDLLIRTLKSRFNSNAVLMPWRDGFNEHSDTFLESD